MTSSGDFGSNDRERSKIARLLFDDVIPLRKKVLSKIGKKSEKHTTPDLAVPATSSLGLHYANDPPVVS
jgi:hypothetical protein